MATTRSSNITLVPFGSLAFENETVACGKQCNRPVTGPVVKWGVRAQSVHVQHYWDTVVDCVILEIQHTTAASAFTRKFEYLHRATGGAVWRPVTRATDYIERVTVRTTSNFTIADISGHMLPYYQALYADVPLPADRAANCVVLPLHNTMHYATYSVTWRSVRDATDYGLLNTYHALCHRVPHDIAEMVVRGVRAQYQQDSLPKRNMELHSRLRYIDRRVFLEFADRKVEFVEHTRLDYAKADRICMRNGVRLFMTVDPPTFDVAQLRPRVTVCKARRIAPAETIVSTAVEYSTDDVLGWIASSSASNAHCGVYDVMPPHLRSTIDCHYYVKLRVDYDAQCATEHGVTVEFEVDYVNAMCYMQGQAFPAWVGL
jgi:hypothetical protein